MISLNPLKKSIFLSKELKTIKPKVRSRRFSTCMIRNMAKYNRNKRISNHQKKLITLNQIRNLSLHEYLSQNIMREFGINVPVGYPAKSVDEAVEVAKKIGGNKWIVKAQVLAGGRGLGQFSSGLKGGVHICNSLDEIREYASKMIGYTLYTKQTGEKGRPVETIYICEVCQYKRENYFAILMDRQTSGPIIVASNKGGVNIEVVAEEDPDAIIKVPIDIMKGVQKEDIEKIAEKLGFNTSNYKQFEDQVYRLYDLFIKKDATMLEINPLVEAMDGTALCLDAKLNFDDNSLYRQKDIEKLRDTKQEDSREVEASKYDLNYIGLDGQIGCMVNGAGLAMATMDIIKLCGGEPANFLDVGGGASEKQVSEAFRILNSDENVESILVNIFGGIMRCDVIANGIINAAKENGIKKPIVLRLQGTNVEKAKELIEKSNLGIITSDSLEEAAIQSVKIANNRRKMANKS